jgi:hypothetical protein
MQTYDHTDALQAAIAHATEKPSVRKVIFPQVDQINPKPGYEFVVLNGRIVGQAPIAVHPFGLPCQ